MPVKTRQGNWIDLKASETVQFHPREYGNIPLGVSMKLPEGYEAYIVPRSSTFSKYGIIQTNGIGIIDNSYSGTDDIWQMPVYAMKETTIPVGARICQFRIVKKQPDIEFIAADRLDEIDRGGFGSTGDF
jgi:dUTP pyrophosphatase